MEICLDTYYLQPIHSNSVFIQKTIQTDSCNFPKISQNAINRLTISGLCVYVTFFEKGQMYVAYLNKKRI